MRRTYNFKKPPMFVTPEFCDMFDQITKSALIDTLWCACQLGTNDSVEEIMTQAARNAVAALKGREDRIPAGIASAAAQPLDSD